MSNTDKVVNVKELKEMIEATNGRFFTCTFVKRDKSVRTLRGRLGVKKGVTGVGRMYGEKEHLVTVYDVEAHQFRNINVETLKEFRCGAVRWTSKD